jgi:transcriptional accessory protein Tex/SPT6
MKHLITEWRRFLKENTSEIPSEVYERYNKGNCLLFAETLKQLLGEDATIMSCIVSFDDGYKWSIAHVFVEYNGNYIDVSGIQTEEQLREKSIDPEHYDSATFTIKAFHPSEWDEFRYDPEYPDQEEQETIDLNKDGIDDTEQTSSPGKMFPEPKEETLKWAKLVLAKIRKKNK